MLVVQQMGCVIPIVVHLNNSTWTSGCTIAITLDNVYYMTRCTFQSTLSRERPGTTGRYPVHCIRLDRNIVSTPIKACKNH